MSLNQQQKTKAGKQKRYNGKQETQLCVDTVHCGKGLKGLLQPSVSNYIFSIICRSGRVQVVHVKNVLMSRY